MAALYRKLCCKVVSSSLIPHCLKNKPFLFEGKLKNIFTSPTIGYSALTVPPPSKLKNASETNKKLMEFFDDEKNWDEMEVKVGRSWRVEDLRIKSNEDLHKLWFVLLKEKNMLLTMEHESKAEAELFPNPERIDKVEESMKNLEDVVRERNRAYFELETGETGERPGKLVNSVIGVRRFYRMQEHFIPRFMNTSWREKYKFGYGGSALCKFVRLYREKLYLTKKKERTRNLNHVQHLFKRYPNMDLEAVRQQYPDVDINKARLHRRARGNHEFNS